MSPRRPVHDQPVVDPELFSTACLSVCLLLPRRELAVQQSQRKALPYGPSPWAGDRASLLDDIGSPLRVRSHARPRTKMNVKLGRRQPFLCRTDRDTERGDTNIRSHAHARIYFATTPQAGDLSAPAAVLALPFVSKHKTTSVVESLVFPSWLNLRLPRPF